MAEPKRFRKKAVEVEAVQYDGSDEAYKLICEWGGGISPGEPGISLGVGEWLIRDEDDHLFTLSAATFEATYEPAPASLQKDDGEGLDFQYELHMEQCAHGGSLLRVETLAGDLEEEAAALEEQREREAESAPGTTGGFVLRARAETLVAAAKRLRDLATELPTSTQPASPSEEGLAKTSAIQAASEAYAKCLGLAETKEQRVALTALTKALRERYRPASPSPVEGGCRVEFSGRTAIALRYILPLVAESLRLAPETKGREGETFAMLEEAVGDIDRALPPEFRGAIDDAYIAEKRMDAIDLQRAAGVRPPAPDVPATPDKDVGEVGG